MILSRFRHDSVTVLLGLTVAGPAAAGLSPAECEVWNREVSFARSLAAHDRESFASHLHPGAIFIGDRGQLSRGREAVVSDWSSLIDGTEIRLSWHPTSVVIGDDPDIALSRGPYWMESLAKDAPQPVVQGQFISIWTRRNGEWKVQFDGGGGNRPEAATAEQIATLKASLPQTCPAG